MSEKTERVDYRESLSILVGRFLLLKGFGLADEYRWTLESLVDRSSLGILYNDPNTKPTYLLGIFKKKPLQKFVATIWFEKERLNAIETNWVIEAYGREYSQMLKQLAEELATIFSVNIRIELKKEEAEFGFGIPPARNYTESML